MDDDEIRARIRKAVAEGKITRAESTVIEQRATLCRRFMQNVVGLKKYLVTDQTSLTDFRSMGEDRDEWLATLRRKALEEFHVDITPAGTNLKDVLVYIERAGQA
jgi:hypothetical protein